MTDEQSRPLTRNIAPFGLRMPPDLKERVEAAAKANNRSMNAEIVAVLEEKFPAPKDPMRAEIEDAFRYLLSLPLEDRKQFIDELDSRAKQMIPEEHARQVAVSVYRVLNDHAPNVEYWQSRISEIEAEIEAVNSTLRRLRTDDDS